MSWLNRERDNITEGILFQLTTLLYTNLGTHFEELDNIFFLLILFLLQKSSFSQDQTFKSQNKYFQCDS